MSVSVTCLAPDCDIPKAGENLQFRLSTSGDNQMTVTPIVTVTQAWVDGGGMVTPDLGAGFVYQGHTKEFIVQGTFQVCDGVKML